MQYKVAKVAMAFMVASLLLAQPLWASEEELRQEIAALKAKLAEVDQLKVKVAELEKQVGEQKCSILAQQGTVQEVKASLQNAVPAQNLIKYAPGEGVELPCGFKMQADATFVLQGTSNANNVPQGSRKAECDASWSADLFIEKAFDDWGLALLHIEPGNGSAAESRLNLFSNVNRDSNETNSNMKVTELWYEHNLFNKQFTVTAGKIDPENYLDQNVYAHDETTQFLGRIFRSSPAVEWPNDNTLGASIAIAPEVMSYLVLSASYLNANDSWSDVFSKPFASAQLTFTPAKVFGYDEKMWGGNYRIYWWYNGLDHQKYVAQGESPADDAKNKNTGFGLSFDQMITDNFGVFTRFAWQRPDIVTVSESMDSAPVEAAWSAGIQINGKLWKREDDVLACAVGQAIPSKACKDAGNGGAPEGHFEAYYKIKVTKNLALSPDIQYIWNPHGIDQSYQGYEHSIFVYGMRGQLDF